LKEPYFSSKDLALMSIFGCLSSLSTLTTAFIPAPLPGLYALISIPVGTILVLTARTVIGKIGAATLTQFISGLISTFLPGGPPVKWIIVPAWAVGGIVIDTYFQILSYTRKSRSFYAIIGSIYIVPGDFIIYWAFSTFLGWTWPILFFLYGFVAIHAILGGLTGFFLPDILERIKPEIKRISNE